MLACFSFALLAIITGQIFFLYHANADTVTDFKDISVVGTVGSIQSGPTVIESPGGGGFMPISTSTSPSLPLELSPSLTVGFKDGLVIGKKNLSVGGNQEQVVDIVGTQYPEFVGHTNIPDAFIYLEIRTKPKIRVKTYADKNGDWTWKSSIPLTSGKYTIYVTATNETAKELSTSVVFDFFVELPPSSTNQISAIPEDAYAIIGSVEPFDVLLKIPDEFKIIAPGDDLLARIKVSNLGNAKQPVVAEIYYTIENSKNEILLAYKEKVTVPGEISLLKSFHTAYTLPVDKYILSAKIYTFDSVVASGDTFMLQGRPVLTLGQYGKINYNLIFQALGLLMFLFLLIIYFEYNKVSILSRLIRRTSEEDLKSEIKLKK
jgi:hypothetical protein